ncbi:MAG: lipocalin family protein [Flavobacteriaceae bacterium]|nr:lipocalin family protein [Flavobacteriaceae bacterium]
MKKFLLLSFLSLILISCGASKEIKQQEKGFSGDWKLMSVEYPDASGFFDVTLFEVASSQCFEGSKWNFIANNNSGSVEIFDNDCIVPEQNLVWSLQQSKQLYYDYDILIKMADDEKASRKKRGSRMQLKQISENSMVWDLNVNFQGKPMIVELNFVKN